MYRGAYLYEILSSVNMLLVHSSRSLRKSVFRKRNHLFPYQLQPLSTSSTSTASVKSKNSNAALDNIHVNVSSVPVTSRSLILSLEDAQRLSGIYSELSKARLSMLVVASGSAGFLLAGAPVALDSLAAVTVGTAFCACAANTFNQVYERKTDRLMKRTRRRPLPSGRISTPHALSFGLGCTTLGTGILAAGCNPLTAVLGFSNIFLYSLVYTPMKQKSEANTWIGAVVGAIPPLMGYAAATGTIASPEALILSSGLFLWQFPHFFSLAWMIKKDYSAGGHQMVPCFDKTGDVTSKLLTRYSIALSTLPFASYGLGITSFMFPLESLAFNGYLMHTCRKFHQNSNDENARKVFLTTLWNLPLFMFLMIFHKKDFLPEDASISDSVVLSNQGSINVKSSYEDAVTDVFRRTKSIMKSLCVHEALTPDSEQDAEMKPFCLSKENK